MNTVLLEFSSFFRIIRLESATLRLAGSCSILILFILFRAQGDSYAYTPLLYVQLISIYTRKLTRLRRRIGLQVKLFLLNLYKVGSLPCILKSNWIGLQVKLGRGEREREREK